MRPPGVLLACVLAGCSGGSATPADAEVDAPPPCTHLQNLRMVRGTAETFGSATTRFPGEICVEGRADLACATTDAAGSFQACVPSLGDFGARFTSPGFEPTVYLLGPAAFPTAAFTIGDDAYVGSVVWSPIGGSYPPTTTGHLAVVVQRDNGDGTTSRLAGATVAIAPSVGLTVVYADANGRPDLARTTTSAAGQVWVADVTPGMYDLTVTSAANPTCTLDTRGYVSPIAAQQVRLPVVAATTVVATMTCKP